MAKHGNVQEVMSARQFREVANELPADLPKEIVQLAIGRKKGLRDALRQAILKVAGEKNIGDEISSMLANEKMFYQDVYGIDYDFTKVTIPPHVEGFDRLLINPQGLTIEKRFQKCVERFGAWKFTHKNLDKVFSNNDRDPNRSGTYAIWIRGGVEAENVHQKKTPKYLIDKGVMGMTLAERLDYELKYFWASENHLDRETATFCIGSRGAEGVMPAVSWSISNMLLVNGYGHENYGNAQPREVVSL